MGDMPPEVYPLHMVRVHLRPNGTLMLRPTNRAAAILLTGSTRSEILLTPDVITRVACIPMENDEGLMWPGELVLYGRNGWNYQVPYREAHYEAASALLDALRSAGYNVET